MTENTKERKPTLVLGGSGKTGRRVVERLRARGLPVRVGWSLSFDDNPEPEVRHWSDSGFLTEFEGEIFAQFADIHLPISSRDWLRMSVVRSPLETCSARIPRLVSGLVPLELSGPMQPADPDRFARDLAAAISSLMADPARREAMGRAGRRRAIERFSWASIAAQTAVPPEPPIRSPSSRAILRAVMNESLSVTVTHWSTIDWSNVFG